MVRARGRFRTWCRSSSPVRSGSSGWLAAHWSFTSTTSRWHPGRKPTRSTPTWCASHATRAWHRSRTTSCARPSLRWRASGGVSMGTLSSDQIAQLGLAAVGTGVAISDRCSIYGAASISIGDHVRIDDFAILTARQPVVIGSYVHISAFAFLSGPFGVVLPGVSFGEGAVVGALSLVKEPLAPWGIYGGVPARLIRLRNRNVEELAARLTAGAP